MPKRWMRLDREVGGIPRLHLTEDDKRNCVYARDYITGFSDEAKKNNNDIANFKHSGTLRGTGAWYYRCQAVKMFAREIAEVIGDKNYAVSYVPGSKLKTDGAYNNRFEDLLTELRGFSATLNPIEVFTIREACTPAHENGERRPHMLEPNLIINEEVLQGVERLVLIDDVVTTGGHFKACKNKVLARFPHIEVYGLFWGRSVNPPLFEVYEDPPEE